MSKSTCYIFDIDGTLADCSHRLHHLLQTPKDWESFYINADKDEPIEATCAIARALSFNHKIVFVTGRPETYRELTQQWLWEHARCQVSELWMRKPGDRRPDYIVKQEIYKKHLKNKYNVIGVFEDREQVVGMWRKLGLVCYQCADGEY